MRLSLLGPLTAESDGTQLLVTAAKQRAVLAALAINANNVVNVDKLAEAIWGSEPPPTRDDTIRTYIHRLRKCLGAEGKRRITIQPPGYILRIEPGELDLLRFESLVREGRASVDASDWRNAARLLRQADGLWRGTALADIPARHLHERYIRYLEQTRLTALELRIEADIRASRHGAAGTVPELEVLTARYPERERLRLLRMLALYRASRQAEALAVFRETRCYSIAEHGVDPGLELTHVHNQILAQEAGLLSERLDRVSFA